MIGSDTLWTLSVKILTAPCKEVDPLRSDAIQLSLRLLVLPGSCVQPSEQRVELVLFAQTYTSQ